MANSLLRKKAWRAVVVASLLGGAGTACTIINNYEQVAPFDAGVADAPADTAPPEDTGPVDAGQDAAQRGAIVVGGEADSDGSTENVLTALDPETGKELPKAREKMVVSAVLYDGLRDLWYIFESGGASAFPQPSDQVLLHVRQLDTNTGAWTNLYSSKVPTLVAFNLVGVLRERVVYVAYNGSDAATGRQLITLDTSNPSQIALFDQQDLDVPPFGMIATRSTSGVGGVANLLRTGGCDGGVCALEAEHVTVSPTDKPQIDKTNVKQLRTFGGAVAYGSYLTDGVDVIGASDKVGSSQVRIDTYQPKTPGITAGAAINTLSTNDQFLKPFAFSECLHQAFAVATNTDLLVYSVPLKTTSAPPTTGNMSHSGQGVYFEPYTATVLTPFSQGSNYELTAFTLTGTEPAPVLTRRAAPSWTPPDDLRPDIVATRTPIPFTCP
jgi:hypothetical protein